MSEAVAMQEPKAKVSGKIKVVKRDGVTEEFQIDKIHKLVACAIDGLSGVTISDVEINSNLNIADGITTDQIHSVLIESAANLISEQTPDYQYVAGRLLNYRIRKNVWGGKNPPKLINLINVNIGRGYYTPKLSEWYTVAEINKIDEMIDHDRDFNYTYCSVKQLCEKYMANNKHTGELYETPQFRYIVAAMTVFSRYTGSDRMAYVRRAYNYFSKFKINLATPQLAGLGTVRNSFASCCLIEQEDTVSSLVATNMALANATVAGYGIGINYGRIRAIKSPVNNGALPHTGVVPFLKVTEANTKAWKQASTRSGATTVNFPIWHLEIDDVVQLKNSTTGTNDSRVLSLDYVIGISRLFYSRLLNALNNGGGETDITLFSPSDVPGLYDAFGTETFDDLYLKYEQDKSIRRRVIDAKKLFTILVKERLETGRIYIFNVDNANEYGSWNDQVSMTNLCVEVTHAIKPLRSYNDPDSEIGVCVLSAINALEVGSDEEHEKICEIVVRMLDELIDIQDYFDLAAKNFCQNKRSIGVGITNLAAYLAKNKVMYTDDAAVDLVDEFMEKQQYYLIKASIKLAREKGPCAKFNTSKYSKGILPIDRKYKDQITKRKPSLDWESLRADLNKYGMRNCTLSAQMPCESSAAAQNVTNGVEPARTLFGYKSSKSASIPHLVPNIKSHASHYQLAFDMPSNIGYLNVTLAMQRWIDMAMSCNQYYSPAHYADRKIPYAQIIKEILHFYKYGGKSLYYLNTDDGNKHFEKEGGCASGACSL